MHLLARDARISQATAYRYLHEAIDVIAANAPDLPEVLAAGHQAGWGYVCLDGTLIETSRSSTTSVAIDNQARNLLITALRAPAERADALLKSSFKALRRVTLCPQRIGHIAAAGLVILTMHRGRW